MRIANRLIALILAAAIIVVGVIFIVEIIAARSGAEPAIYNWHAWLRWGRTNTWKATSVELACAIVALVGLLLLLPQLRRRRPTRLGVEAGDGATDAALTRKGVMVTVRGAVGDVEGIAGSSVKVGRHRIQVNAVSSAATIETANTSKAAVKVAAQQAIDELRLTANRRLRVNVATHKKGGV
jgi:hypothetical protein